jgi:hypothetical protein
MQETHREHLINYLFSSEVDLVLSRVSDDLKGRLGDVDLRGNHLGMRRLGYVMTRGRRDITLCTRLPPRVSLRGFLHSGQSAAEFGAPTRGQWPPWSVRRFLLYDVLLHELGHLQLVRPAGRSWRRRYADERLADEFARDLRRDLFAHHLEHPDPIHNSPTPLEQELLEVWIGLDKASRGRLVDLVLKPDGRGPIDTSWLGDLSAAQRAFLDQAVRRPRPRLANSGERPTDSSISE